MSNNAPDSRLSLDTTPEPHNPRGYEAELDPLFFQQIPNVLINDVAKNRLKPIDVIVYAVLKKHVGNNACCWAGNRTVARLCGVSNATVRRSIKNLVRAGHIERKNCTDGKAAYTYLRTTIVDGRAVCGVPPVPPRQSCHAQTLAAPSATIAPVVLPLPVTESETEDLEINVGEPVF